MTESKKVVTEYVAKLNTSSYRSVSQALSTQSQAQIKAAKSNIDFTQELIKLRRQELKELERIERAELKAAKAEKTRLEILEDRNSAIRRQAGSLGDVDTSLATFSSAANSFGARGAGEALGGVAELFAVSEGIAQLKGSAPAATEAVKTLAKNMGVSGVGLGAAAIGLTVVLAAATAEANRRAESAKILLDSQREYFDLVQSGTSESITSARESAQATLDASRQELATRKAQREAISKDITNTYSVFLDGFVELAIASGATGGEVKALDTTIRELENTVLENELAVTNYDKALQSAQVAQNDLTQSILKNASDTASREQFILQTTGQSYEQNLALSQQLLDQNSVLATEYNALRASGDTSDEVTKRLNELSEALLANDEKLQLLRQTAIPWTRQLQESAEAVKANEEALKEAEQVDKQREATLTRLNALESQSLKLLEDFERKQSETTQDRQIRDLQNLEDFEDDRLQAEASLNRDLLKISRDGNARITEARQAVTDFDRDYMRNTIKEHRDYNDEVEKLNRQRDLEDIQRRRQHLFDLSEAESNNDVLAFLRLQAQFKNEQQTRKENESLEDKERRDQLNKTLEDNRQAYLERRRLLLQEVTERQNALRQSIAEAREKAQIENDLKQAQFDKELARQQQQDQIRDQRDREALQRSLNAINIKAQAELTAIRAVTNAVSQLVAVANRISANTGNSQYNSTRSSGTGYQTYEQRLAQITAQNTARRSGDIQQVVRLGGAFAKGGIRGMEVHKKPTLSLTGEGDLPEMIIPFRPSKGVQSALRDYGLMPRNNMGSSGMSVTVQFSPNVTIGDIASKAEVTSALQSAFDNYTHQLGAGLTKAINQSN